MVAYTQRRKRTVFNLYKEYDYTTFTSRVNVLSENTIRTEGIQFTLYFIMRSIYLVTYCCFYENIVCINSTVNVKQKQI